MTEQPPAGTVKPVTISYIAQTAGVSIPTVSKVINGRSGVAAETRGPRRGADQPVRLPQVQPGPAHQPHGTGRRRPRAHVGPRDHPRRAARRP
ncbi:LacI family DNA-binding transcriptional regulator [Actinoplanes sp. NEAU-H7]|uniref:LacI family DNA-binding transcriptional regulator n=1 Tax=Actinoplanes flavus TaxID=2820290 RepID=A0ABS3UXE8_9ACTN|nr:LacI family DNA-binding transcriptional regulator [Actinoplanes flavus]